MLKLVAITEHSEKDDGDDKGLNFKTYLEKRHEMEEDSRLRNLFRTMDTDS